MAKIFPLQAIKDVIYPLKARGSSYRHLVVESEYDRGHWESKAEFMLSCIGLSVGLGNLWRFPTLAYNNGGAAFFIPYIILQLLIGKPMYFMELALGQYAGQGPVGIFSMNPGAKGVGISMVVVAVVLAIYYNVIMAYTLYFTFASMQSVLPWTTCKNEWIAENCYVRVGHGNSMPTCGTNSTSPYTDLCKCTGQREEDFDLDKCSSATGTTSYAELLNLTTTACPKLLRCTNKTRTPAHFYFYTDVIQRTDSLSDIDDPIWYLALCLMLSWIIVILCLLHGVKSSGKVVYFTATFPYFVLLALLIKGATLPGSLRGVTYFLIPTWSKLADVQVWKAAGGQMFFSLTVSFGAIVTLGSYNRFRNNVYIDSLVISGMDIFTSFIAGLVVFTTLGAMAYDTGIDIKDVAASGYGLAFVAYPEALSALPVSQFWSIIFFFMLFTLGVDSEFGLMETALTTITDEFPKLLKYKMYITICSGAVCYLLALPLVTPGGDNVLNLMDLYGCTYTVFVICFGEIASVIWVYGVRNFLRDTRYMLGFSPHPVWFWVVTWVVIAPVLVMVILILSLVFYKPLEYSDQRPIEKWAQGIGWLLMVAVLLPIPVTFVWTVFKSEGANLKEKIIAASKPSKDWHPQPHDNESNEELALEEVET